MSILETDETRESCESPRLVKAFGSLADSRDYVLAPAATSRPAGSRVGRCARSHRRQDGSPLTLAAATDGATDGDGGENEHSLKIPAQGSALSPAMCVDLHWRVDDIYVDPRR